MRERVTSPAWSPYEPWDTQPKLGEVWDDGGGYPLVRVAKRCPRCTRRYEGWTWATAAPTKLLGQVEVNPDGTVVGLCDLCGEARDHERAERRPAQATHVSARALRRGTPQPREEIL